MFDWSKNKKREVYLDYMASTPVDRRVVAAMKPYWSELYAHPWAIHSPGIKVRELMTSAKTSIACHLAARPEEIIFTSSGTEASTQALRGYIDHLKKTHGDLAGYRIVLSSIEHPSVGGLYNYVKGYGMEVDLLPVEDNGIVEVSALKELLTEKTVLVSVVYVNSEIGTIQPISEIAKVIHRHNTDTGVHTVFHTDASQATLYLDCNVEKLGVDMMTLDAHKMYGPKGIGALYVKKGVNLEPLFFGSSNKAHLRNGTPAVPLIIGFAKAFDIAVAERSISKKKVEEVRGYCIEQIAQHFPTARLNGDTCHRAPQNVSISFKDQNHEFMLVALDMYGISVATRSACSNDKDDPSGTLKALFDHYNPSAIRLSLGKETTRRDIDYLIDALGKILK